jgi:hypothetical protein
MTIEPDDEMEAELCFGPMGLDRDWPLDFRWRTEPRFLTGLGLPSARNDRYEDARNAVLTAATLAGEVDRCVSFSRRKEFYAARRRYHGTSFTYHTVLAAVADGVRAGLLEEERALPGLRGRQSRFRATPLLSRRLKDCPAHFQSHEVIWLRDNEGTQVDYADTARTRRMRGQVEAINSNMSKIAVGLEAHGVHKVGRYWVVSGHHLLPTPPRVYRVFNRGSFRKGGRLYGWWQGLPSRYRAIMTINGEPVLEPDFAQLHAQIIYGLRDIPLIGDAYETGEFPRQHGKLAFNIAVNAKNQRSAVAAISEHLRIEKQTASKLLDAIIAKHNQVAGVFCTDAGVTLMRIDSDITLDAVKHCQAQGILVLPVHDSLIVQERHAEQAAESMIKAFATRFPHRSTCQIRIKAKTVPQMVENGSLRDTA